MEFLTPTVNRQGLKHGIFPSSCHPSLHPFFANYLAFFSFSLLGLHPTPELTMTHLTFDTGVDFSAKTSLLLLEFHIKYTFTRTRSFSVHCGIDNFTAVNDPRTTCGPGVQCICSASFHHCVQSAHVIMYYWYVCCVSVGFECRRRMRRHQSPRIPAGAWRAVQLPLQRHYPEIAQAGSQRRDEGRSDFCRNCIYLLKLPLSAWQYSKKTVYIYTSIAFRN